MSDENKDLKTGECAERLGCCSRTVRNYLKRGYFPGSYKVGHTWRIPASTFEKYRTKQIQKYQDKIFGLDRVPAEWKENTENKENTEKPV